VSGPPEVIAEIRRIYYATTKATIHRDLARAIALLKILPTEEAREGAAVYMDGLAQMRSEWAAGEAAPTGGVAKAPKRRRRQGP
jgi:hypothetical protein